MSRKIKQQHAPRLTAHKIDMLLANPKPLPCMSELAPQPQTESASVMPKKHEPLTLSSVINFDSLDPVGQLQTFMAFAKDVITRYEENQRLWEETDKQTQDILHFIELSPNMNAVQGYHAYKKLADVRRNRRLYKSEIDLLQPLYEYLTNNMSVINQLTMIQGKCRTNKETIQMRSYSMRTEVIS